MSQTSQIIYDGNPWKVRATIDETNDIQNPRWRIIVDQETLHVELYDRCFRSNIVRLFSHAIPTAVIKCAKQRDDWLFYGSGDLVPIQDRPKIIEQEQVEKATYSGAPLRLRLERATSGSSSRILRPDHVGLFRFYDAPDLIGKKDDYPDGQQEGNDFLIHIPIKCKVRPVTAEEMLYVEQKQDLSHGSSSPSQALSEKRAKAAKENRTVKDKGDRAKIRAAVLRKLKQTYSPNQAHEEVARLCKENKNLLELKGYPYLISARTVRRIIKGK